MRPDQQMLANQYRRRFGAEGAYRDGVWSRIVSIVLRPRIGRPRRVLDLGCGWGEFSRHVAAPERFAMDLNPEAAAHLDTGVRFLEHDCTRPWPLPDASLDLVFSSNFLEHLPDKAAVMAALREARRCLAPGGQIVLVGPNLRFTGGAYWDFWDHHVPLTERSLAEALELLDFRIEECRPRFLPYSMSQGRNPPLPLVSVYLHLPFLWPLVGRQFLLRAQVGEEAGDP